MIGKVNKPNNVLKKKQKARESEANLLKHKPECLLVDLIDQRVSPKASEAYGDDAMDGGVPVGDQVASFVRSIPKNGKSPGVGLGHSKQSQNGQTATAVQSRYSWRSNSFKFEDQSQEGWEKQRKRKKQRKNEINRKMKAIQSERISNSERCHLQFFSQSSKGLPILEVTQVHQEELDQLVESNTVDPTGSLKMKKLLRTRTRRGTKPMGQRLPLECARTKLLEAMSNATREDWAFLANFDSLRQNLNVYNHTSRCVVKAGLLVPLPIIWLLTRFNMKHRFCANREARILIYSQISCCL